MGRAVRVIIDCDPGVDDALAIVLALVSPELRVCGITTVAGNAPVDQCTENAVRLLGLVGRNDIPVAAGADRPLVQQFPDRGASWHGANGIGGVVLPDRNVAASPGHAVDLIASVAAASDEPTTIVAIGPLTNIALLLARHPDVGRHVGQITIMGGSSTGGNVTPAAEFNIWVDPEAAHRVFTSGIRTVVVPLDLTHRFALRAGDLARIRTAGPVGDVLAKMMAPYARSHFETYGEEIAAVHDAIAVGTLVRPDLTELIPAHVAVDYTSPISRGATIFDRLGFSGEAANAFIAEIPPERRFREWLLERLATAAALPAAGNA